MSQPYPSQIVQDRATFSSVLVAQAGQGLCAVIRRGMTAPWAASTRVTSMSWVRSLPRLGGVAPKYGR
ncbi:hypothetical protein [Streptomyces anulatus]|uniref:hypothetical protein n=1 Tax=Streptomyces anulatus TaxID=1892 RepID=UPI0013DBE0B3|nr:hypothetical protein [Streptomyces anulatus]